MRPLSDSVFREITDFFCGRDGSFWFALSARTLTSHEDIDGSITGKIFIYKSKAGWRTGPESAIREARDHLNDAHLSLSATKDSEVAETALKAEKELDRSADIIIRLELGRDGELKFKSPTFVDEDLLAASEEFAKEEGGHDFQKWIVDQAYFFLRDLAHHHQHHDPFVDTILIMQELKEDDPISWRQNIVFSLHFHIIAARRAKNMLTMVQAAGILAYCQSFLGICRRKVGSDINRLAVYEEEALKNSLASSAEEIKMHLQMQTDKTARITNFRMMTLAVIAPVLALLGVAIQPNIDKETEFPTLFATGKFVAHYAVELCSISVLLVIFAWTFNSVLNSFNTTRYSRDLLRLGSVNEFAGAATGFLFTLIFAATGVYFGWPTVSPLLDVMRSAAVAWWNWFLN